ncbi:related to flavin-nucleotide-binding protein [Phialocephala subalpina]|uniref:Related to flavin-nucleotide-binding protein n=1 Tax=Phialocephala subalpina TaxID=576137 RepID=A0A1L7WH10_9HELO|nr:related to flavin-nucleotide-binding protein [Phialocephala subalpina]
MSDSEAPTYPKLPRNTVNRYGKPRGKYDYESIHKIVNTVQVLHVSFPAPNSDPFPAMIPMLGFMASYSDQNAPLTEPLDLYLHGYISSRLMKLGSTSPSDEEEGLPLTIAATHLDGLVLALTPNHHSYNYRSAILHGYATPVTDADEKMWAMEKITNGVLDHRWENTRIPPTKTEMTSTQILKVNVVDASAKVRTGYPGDDRADLKNEELRAKTWIGVVPTFLKYGEPVASPENRVAKVPEHITSYVKKENEVGEKNALIAVKGE